MPDAPEDAPQRVAPRTDTITRRCEKADELLEALDLSKPSWAPGPLGWCFRGQDWDEPLVPTALRRGPDLGPVLLNRNGFPPGSAQYPEYQLILSFMAGADRAGLAIPHDAPGLRNYPFGMAFSESKVTEEVLYTWPSDPILAIVALAQHYGVPTRLLDWSYKPLVAAYFATAGLAKEVAGNSGTPSRYNATREMVVWALNLLALPPLFPGKVQGVSRFAVVEAPQASNPNLAAQAGLFTLDREAEEGVGYEVALAKALAAGGRRLRTHDPLFRRFTLPHPEAQRLLRLLGLLGVTAATVFPGHKGVVDSLYERLYWEE